MRTRPGLYADGLLAIARGDTDDTNAQAAAWRVARALQLFENDHTSKGR